MAEVSVRSLSRNSLSAGLLQIWQLGSRLILTPIIISKIGLAGYGTWTLLFTICSYISMFNVSFGFAYTKFTAEYDRRKDYEELSEIVSSGITLIVGLASAVLAVIFCLWMPILRILNVPEELLADARIALLMIGVWLLLRMSIGSAFEILTGLQRIDLQYKLTIVASLIEFIGSLALLSQGYGLRALATSYLGSQTLVIVIAWCLCRRMCPFLRVSPLRISMKGLRLIMSLGGRFQLLALITTGFQQGFRMVLSAVCGTEAVGLFEVAAKILNLGNTAGYALLAPMMPAFAHLHAGKDEHSLQTLYETGSRILAAVCVVSFSVLAVFADVVIRVWTGHEYPLAAWTVRVLVVGYYMTMLTGVATASLRGQGTTRLETWCAAICGICVSALTVPAALSGSYVGFVWAYASGIVGTIWLLGMFARQESIPVTAYFLGIVVQPVLAGLPAILLAIGLRSLYGMQAVFFGGRLGLAIDLAFWAGALTLLLGIAMWFGVLKDRERRAVAGLFRFQDESRRLLSEGGPCKVQ